MKFIYLLTLMLSVTSCLYEDLGNYDYHEINEINIDDSLFKQSYEKVSGMDTLRIHPKISFTMEQDTTRYKYEWKVLPGSSYFGETVIGTNRDLNYPVSLPADTYYALFKITDEKTNLIWTKQFSLKISTVTSHGWLLLCDNGGKTRIDMVHPVNKMRNIVGRNILSYPDGLLGRPIGLSHLSTSSDLELILHTEKTSYNVDRENFTVTEASAIQYDFGQPPVNVGALAVGLPMGGDNCYYMLIDKEYDLYLRAEYDGLYGFRANHFPGEEKYFKMAPFIGFRQVDYWGAYYNSVMFYDQTNQRFLELKADESKLQEMTYEDTELWSSANTGRELVYMENTTDYTYSLLKDQEGRIWLYGVELGDEGCNVQVYYTEVKGENLAQATSFAFHSIHPYLFYTVGQDVYCIDYSVDEPAKKVLSFPGETVSKLRFAVCVSYGTEDWEYDNQYDLVVATNHNQMADDKCGIVRIYNVPELRGELTLKDRPYTSIGRIVDLIYLERK